jgi:hypothetical protein
VIEHHQERQHGLDLLRSRLLLAKRVEHDIQVDEVAVVLQRLQLLHVRYVVMSQVQGFKRAQRETHQQRDLVVTHVQPFQLLEGVEV